MTIQRLIGGLFALTLAGCATASPAASLAPAMAAPTAVAVPEASVHETVVAAKSTDGIDRDWLGFRDNRDGWMSQLGERLIACNTAEDSPECVRRRETFEVGFALTQLYRVTHDPQYLEAADASVFAKQVAKPERFDAYQATWFLSMVAERENLKHGSELHGAATTVAAGLERHLNEMDDYSFAQGAMFGNEQNVALALHGLWSWAQQSDDTALIGRLETLTKERFLGAEMDSWCPMPIDGEPQNSEFLPPCLQRAMTVLAVEPEEVSNPWLSDFLSHQKALEPVVGKRLSTHQSLNFARAVALWSIYKATGDTQYRHMYVDHVNAQMNQLEQTVKAGGEIDPWHAAFGVYAVSLSYDV